MSIMNILCEVTSTSTNAEVPLGTRYERQSATSANGREVWIYVKNSTGSALAAGDVCVRKAGTAGREVIQAASGTVYPRVRIVGVAQHAIADGSYGWILREGIGNVKIGTANVTADTPLTTGGDRAGACIDYADGATTREGAFAYNLASVTTDHTTVSAWIHCTG